MYLNQLCAIDTYMHHTAFSLYDRLAQPFFFRDTCRFCASRKGGTGEVGGCT